MFWTCGSFPPLFKSLLYSTYKKLHPSLLRYAIFRKIFKLMIFLKENDFHHTLELFQFSGSPPLNFSLLIYKFVLGIICLRGKFRINLPSSLFEILKCPEWNEINFSQIFRINMWFLVNHMWQVLKKHTRVRITEKNNQYQQI